jgi:hypothetical protein
VEELDCEYYSEVGHGYVVLVHVIAVFLGDEIGSDEVEGEGVVEEVVLQVRVRLLKEGACDCFRVEGLGLGQGVYWEGDVEVRG